MVAIRLGPCYLLIFYSHPWILHPQPMVGPSFKLKATKSTVHLAVSTTQIDIWEFQGYQVEPASSIDACVGLFSSSWGGYIQHCTWTLVFLRPILVFGKVSSLRCCCACRASRPKRTSSTCYHHLHFHDLDDIRSRLG